MFSSGGLTGKRWLPSCLRSQAEFTSLWAWGWGPHCLAGYNCGPLLGCFQTWATWPPPRILSHFQFSGFRKSSVPFKDSPIMSGWPRESHSGLTQSHHLTYSRVLPSPEGDVHTGGGGGAVTVIIIIAIVIPAPSMCQALFKRLDKQLDNCHFDCKKKKNLHFKDDSEVGEVHNSLAKDMWSQQEEARFEPKSMPL